MFSGIVQGKGILVEIKPAAKSIRLAVDHQGLGRGIAIGESIAVNGCCLTVISNRRRQFHFDVLQETWNRTCFQYLKSKDLVNLEPALRVGDRLGGHFVTGHVDVAAPIVRYEKHRSDVLMEVRPPSWFLKWIVFKGSVAIDGVSLTVAKAAPKSFTVWLIPHTLKMTTLGDKRKGDFVNLEGDMLAKYVQKRECCK